MIIFIVPFLLGTFLVLAATVTNADFGFFLNLPIVIGIGLGCSLLSWVLSRFTQKSKSGLLIGIVGLWPLLFLTLGDRIRTDIQRKITQSLDQRELKKNKYKIYVGNEQPAFFHNPTDYSFPIFLDFEGAIELTFNYHGKNRLEAQEIRDIVKGLLEKGGEKAWEIKIQPVRAYYGQRLFFRSVPGSLRAEIFLRNSKENPSINSRTHLLAIENGEFVLGKSVGSSNLPLSGRLTERSVEAMKFAPLQNESRIGKMPLFIKWGQKGEPNSVKDALSVRCKDGQQAGYRDEGYMRFFLRRKAPNVPYIYPRGFDSIMQCKQAFYSFIVEPYPGATDSSLSISVLEYAK